MKTAILTISTFVLFTACASTPPEARLIDDAAEALGGKTRIEQIKTLSLEGEGEAPNLGQNLMPDSELPVWKVTGLRRDIDLANGRMRVRQVRTAQFLFAGETVQKQDQGIDGDVGYNIAGDGKASRTADAAARARRIDMLHHPVTALRAAFDANAKVANYREADGHAQVDVTTAKGELLTLVIDSASKMPLAVRTQSYNDNLGDVVIETSFADYESVSGIRLPKHLVTKVDRFPQFDLRIARNSVNAEIADAAAPADVKAMSVPAAAAITVTSQEVSKGIWWLAGSGNHRSILFEFDDHLVLFEAPLNETRTKAVIDTARSLRPQKPLTHVVVSHHHFDHSGGLRVAIAEGLTIITHRSNVEFFKELASRKHSVQPDALARNPKPLKIEPVDDETALKDNSMEVRLYHVKNNPREGTNLFAYVPRGRILVQADLYDSGWLQHPWGDNIPYNVSLHKLQVDKDVPVHGDIQSYADVLKTIASKGKGAAPGSN